MNISPRAATQLRALAADRVGVILDVLGDRSFGPGSYLVDVAITGMTYRCFVARDKDHALILLSVVGPRSPYH